MLAWSFCQIRNQKVISTLSPNGTWMCINPIEKILKVALQGWWGLPKAVGFILCGPWVKVYKEGHRLLYFTVRTAAHFDGRVLCRAGTTLCGRCLCPWATSHRVTAATPTEQKRPCTRSVCIICDTVWKGECICHFLLFNMSSFCVAVNF